MGSNLCYGPVHLKGQTAVKSLNNVSSILEFVILKALGLEF